MDACLLVTTMDDEKPEPEIPSEITFNFNEGPDYRVIRADGAWAGITPQLEIQFALFNDLQPMPNTTRHKVLPNGAVGPEIARDADEGIDREVSVMVVMNPAVVMQFIKLLQGMLGQVVT